MKKHLFLLFGLIVLVLLSVGCDIPTKAMNAEYHSPVDFRDLEPAPNCGTGSLVKPINLYPAHEAAISDPSPDLMWDFEGCDVYSFTINMSDTAGQYMGNVVHDDVLEDEHILSIDTDYLEDCTTYYWFVIGWGSNDYKSDVAIFRTDFTGNCPVREPCAGAPPTPISVSPSGSMLPITNPQLLWLDSEPGCDVENYHYEVSHTPDFTDIVMEGDTNAHSVEFEDPYIDEDCSYYFWRVSAEANGYTRTSDVLQFSVTRTGACMHYTCTADTMMAPELVFPIDGATVSDTTPQFVWDYDLDTCHPDHFVIEVTDTPDFTYNLWQSVPGWKHSWTPSYESNFSNCTTYYWRVSARTMPATTIVNSEVFSFTTNFGNTICGLMENPHIPIEWVRDFDLGCVSGSQQWAIYDFLGPILGEYEVRIGNRSWPCQLLAGTNNQLMCYGAKVPPDLNYPVELFLEGFEEPVLTLEDTAPPCADIVVCNPPPEGCPPMKTNPEWGMKSPTVPTHWDPAQCACVP